MNILFLSRWLPWPPFDGERIRVFETLRYLSRTHRLTLLTAVRRPQEIEHASILNRFCEQVVMTTRSQRTAAILRRLTTGTLHGMPLIQSFFFDTRLARQVQDLTSQKVYDIVHVEFSTLVPYLTAVSSRCQAKKVLTMHNIESIRLERERQFSAWNGRRLLSLWDHLFFASWEKKALRQFDGIAAVSNSERTWIQHQAPAAVVELVPNGVDCEYFSPSPPLNETLSIVFTGSMDYPANVDAVSWFCDETFPLLRRKIPKLFFRIVGSNPPPKVLELGKREGVHVTGEVEDVRPYIAESLALVVPLRWGGGTRLKILQAMAMERPVISTSLGAEGLEVTPEANILIANNTDQFVNSILSLLTQPNLANRLGTAGRELVREKYDWAICLRSLEGLYDKLLESRDSSNIAVPLC